MKQTIAAIKAQRGKLGMTNEAYAHHKGIGINNLKMILYGQNKLTENIMLKYWPELIEVYYTEAKEKIKNKFA